MKNVILQVDTGLGQLERRYIFPTRKWAKMWHGSYCGQLSINTRNILCQVNDCKFQTHYDNVFVERVGVVYCFQVVRLNVRLSVRPLRFG